MKIVVAGSSGFIGKKLVSTLEGEGHTVVCLKRGDQWNPQGRFIESSLLEGADGVINLCGDNIASGSWTPEKKKRIFESRIFSTKTLAEAISKMESPPNVFINASAVGFYGDRGDEELNEESGPGNLFISQVCEEWERMAQIADQNGVRSAQLRIGVVLSKEGGALKRMLLPFKLGLGGRIGSGEQYMSWIAMEDLLSIFSEVLKNEQLRGPINAVAPQPVTNSEFTKTLGKALSRPTIFPMPAFAAKAAFGTELAEQLLLSSTRALPKKLLASQFSFKHPTLVSALS